MAKKFVITVTPYWLFVIGEWVGELKRSLEQSPCYYEAVSGPLAGLGALRDTEKFKFIGEKAHSLWDDFYKKYSSQENAYLDSKDIESLKVDITRWETRLQELSKNWLLSYPDTHLDASKLREGAKAFLSDDEFKKLYVIDFLTLSEAASSLLFDNFTSAEFMALRTAESLLKRWYEKRKDIKLGKTTWGEVLEKLSQEFLKKEERPKELLLLDYLRERRNEIAHPEARSNSVAASTTFLNVISLYKSLFSQQD
jgi:hypothetical protein